ncbi:MAG: hypothetical protein FIB05_07775 [Betaproteobacteria bacterium]|nr:hypothetical protein [Betaproteobacteria bacterium]PWB62361.1 MAG: hypothetical protein C3F16_06795 [Betaproteobacteria bacterium]
MSESKDLLAIRKDLLVAQSSLYRLKVVRDAARVRESLSLGHVSSAIAGSSTAREVALGLLLTGLGSGRVSRLFRLASRTLVVARLALAAFGMLRAQPKPPPEPQPPPST